jgi:hypothetical protein
MPVQFRYLHIFIDCAALLEDRLLCRPPATPQRLEVTHSMGRGTILQCGIFSFRASDRQIPGHLLQGLPIAADLVSSFALAPVRRSNQDWLSSVYSDCTDPSN